MADHKVLSQRIEEDANKDNGRDQINREISSSGLLAHRFREEGFLIRIRVKCSL